MSFEPSPFTRLLHLEQAVEQLVAANLSKAVRNETKQPPASRAIWPADQLLLTRMLRRSPEVLKAYQASAQLSVTKERGIHLCTSEAKSVFQFCELVDGDAVVWLDINSPDWVWESASFRSIFDCPSISEPSSKLVLQELPLFKPICRGETWVLQHRGEMVVQPRPFPEHADQARLLRRLELLERHVGQHNIRLESSIQELRTQVRVQQNQIDQLLRLFPNS
jgi:hypothetical protein